MVDFVKPAPIFSANQFKSDRYPAKDKAFFADIVIKFIERDFTPFYWTRGTHEFLSQLFDLKTVAGPLRGMAEFSAHWFEGAGSQLAFLQHVSRYQVRSDSAMADVEFAIKRELIRRKTLTAFIERHPQVIAKPARKSERLGSTFRQFA